MAEQGIVEIIIKAVDQTKDGLTTPIRSLGELGKGLEEVAAKTQFSLAALASMTDRASKTGVSTDVLSKSIANFHGVLAAAANGATPAASALTALGVSLKDADGSARPTQAIFRDLADKFKGTDDGAKKNALALQLFGAEGKKLVPILNQGSAGLDKMVGSAKKLGAADFASNLAKLGPAITFVAMAAATAFAAIAAHSIEVMDATGKAAQSLGMTSEQLSTLRYAAEKGGVSAENFDTSMRALNKSVVEASQGNEKTKAAFAALGISVTDASGKVKAGDQVLYELADAFSKSKDGAAKTAIAMELMSRGGAAMIPVLNGGSDGLREMQQRARDLNLEVSGPSAEAAANFNDNLQDMRKMVVGVAQSVASEVLPQLVSWTKQTIDFIQQNGILTGVIWTIVDVFKVLAGVIKAVWDLISVFIDLFANQLITLLEGLKAIVSAAKAASAALHGNFDDAKVYASEAASHLKTTADLFLNQWVQAGKGVGKVFDDLNKLEVGYKRPTSSGAVKGKDKGDANDKKNDIQVVDLESLKKQEDLYNKTMEEIGKSYAKAADSQYQQIVQEYDREAKIVKDYYDKERDLITKSVAPQEQKDRQIRELNTKQASDLEKAEELKNRKIEELTQKTLDQVKKEYLQATNDRIGAINLEYERKKEQIQKELDGSTKLKEALDQLEKAHTQTVLDEVRRRQNAYDDAYNHIKLSGLTGLNAQIANENHAYSNEQRDINQNKDYTSEQKDNLLKGSNDSHNSRVDKMGSDLGNQMAVEGFDTDTAWGQTQQRLAAIQVERQAEEQLYEDRKRFISQLAIDGDKKRALEEQNERSHQLKLTNFDRATFRDKLAMSVDYSNASASIMGNMANAAKAFGKQGFVAYKAFASAQALMNTYSSAVAAYNSMAGIPFIGPALAAAAAAAAIAAGLANVAQINSAQPTGQAHEGMTYIQRPGSWYLDGGERVVASNQNADLVQFMSEMRDNRGNGLTQVNVHLDGRPILKTIANGIRGGRLDVVAGRAY